MKVRVISHLRQRGVIALLLAAACFSARVVAFEAPDNPPGTTPGLQYQYYTTAGAGGVLPDFTSLTAAGVGVLSASGGTSINSNLLTNRTLQEYFSFQYKGYIYVPTQSTYTFYTESDDGSRLYIRTTLVVENNAAQGMTERSGQIPLQAGYHQITIQYGQGVGGYGMNVRYRNTSGISKQIIPDSAYFYVPPTATPVILPAITRVMTPTVDVTMTCATQGANIYYTTNGINPTTASTPYSGQVTLSVPIHVKAGAQATNQAFSYIASAVYIDAHPPANDDFAAAQVISGALPQSKIGNNFNGTAQTGEPGHGGIGPYRSVWFTWTATATGDFSVSVAGNSSGGAFYPALADTTLGVYTGNAVNALTTIGSSDDVSSTDSSSLVVFHATLGTVYYFAVDGFNRTEGTYQLTLQGAPTISIAATDAIATEPSADIGRYTISRTGSTAAALTVYFSPDGTATQGGDYVRLPDFVVIGAGQASTTLTITPIDDVIYEGPEAVDVILTPRSTYLVSTTNGTATVALNDNEAAVTGTVEDTQFSHRRGFYTASFNLSITTATVGATIKYTLDGTVPTTTNGTTYSAPIVIDQNRIVRAFAYKAGMNPTNVDTQTYLFNASTVVQSPTGSAPPTGGSWPAAGTLSTGQIIDYGMDPNIVNVAPWNAAVQPGLQSLATFSVVMNLNDAFNTSTGFYANPNGSGIAWERACSIELIDPNGDTQHQFQSNCGIRLRGGYSRSTSNPKHGLRFFFREQYGAGSLDFQLIPGKTQDKFKQFDLRTFQNYSWSFEGNTGSFCAIRDVFSRDAQAALGQITSGGDYYHLYLNGHYWGIYNIDERPEADFGASYFGGNADDYDVIKVDPQSGYIILATDGNMDAWTRLWKQCKAGLSSNESYFRIQGRNGDSTLNPSYENLLDVDNMIDYMLVIYYGGNLDAPISNFLGNTSPNNFFAFRSRVGAGGFRFVSHDAEHTLLNVNENRTGPFTSGDQLNKSNPQWFFQQCTANQEFLIKFADRVQKHFINAGGVFTPAGATALFNVRKTRLDPAIVDESARWGDSKIEPPATKTNWLNVCNGIINNYFPQRTNIVLNQFKARGWFPNINAPSFSPQNGGAINPGFILTITNTNGVGRVYYTTDGSDPRALGGTINSSAVDGGPTTVQVTLNATTTVRARALNGGVWSAITEGTFDSTQDFTALKLTEVMYNPPNFGDIDGAEVEFVELKNTGASALNLSGATFGSGLSYTFPPGTILNSGAFYVLCSNATQFQLKYPGVTPNGTYIGRLSNSGEQITLQYSSGATIFSMTFADGLPWPATADGLGFSMVPVQPNANPDMSNPDNWRGSTNLGGSPGADDPEPGYVAVIINEVLTHSNLPSIDYIELYNPSATQAADISGWFLTDDSKTPKKYKFPPGSNILPKSYLVIDEDQFNNAGAAIIPFSLSSQGDEAGIFSADSNGNLTGYCHGLQFDASASDVSFGRYIISTGEAHYPAQIQETSNAVNSGPRVGPVVISEIMYNPASGNDEFVEIVNISNAPVELYDPLIPANVWKLSGIDFDFPPNTVLEANQPCVLCAMDPAAFRTKYNVPVTALVLGPYIGNLQDSGELLELKRPDAPDVDGMGNPVIPYVTIDAVRYNDKSPWPLEPDGNGPSLSRRDIYTYGNDPINWARSNATGGSPGTLETLTPASPGSVTATGTADDSIRVDWVDRSNTESGFKIERSINGINSWIQINEVGQNIQTFNDSGLTAATDYYYRVYSYNAFGPSEYSNVAKGRTLNPPPPATPLNFAATAVSDSEIDLAWTPSDVREKGFRIESSLDGVNGWTLVTQTLAGATQAQHTGLEPYTLYYYRIQAFSDFGESGYAFANTRTLVPPPPDAPDGLTATALTYHSVELAWNDNSGDETGFKIERSPNGVSNWTEITAVGANVEQYTNTALQGATRYYYRVAAFHDYGTSDWSNIEDAVTLAPPVPESPSNLAADAIAFNRISLTWTDNSSTETAFRIERSFDGNTNWTTAVTVGANVQAHTVSGLNPSTHYYFRVFAYHDNGASQPSNTADDTTPPPSAPVTPAIIAATAVSYDKINVAWTDNSDNEAGFLVERSLNNVNWAEAGRTSENAVSFQDTGLAGETLYYYRTSAFHAYGASGYSAVVSAITPPGPPLAPANLTAVAASDAKINLSWAASANAATYNVERSPDGTTGWSNIASVQAPVVVHQDTSLQAATLYFYRVAAENPAGTSGYSPVASATTFSSGLVDSDGDGIDDHTELYDFGTNPNNSNSKPGGTADLDADASTDDHDLDDDGDGVDTPVELAAGNDPFDKTSYPTTPMQVTKLQCKANFKKAGKDAAQITGTIPKLPANFNFAGAIIRVNVGGGEEAFTLDAKGKAKSKLHGSVALTIVNKRNPDVIPYAIKIVNEDWVAFWADEGFIPGSKEKLNTSFVVEIRLAGKVFTATVAGTYSNGAFKGPLK